jgi:hypothetical protein
MRIRKELILPVHDALNKDVERMFLNKGVICIYKA